jgi:DNA-binding transcriptional regulator YhcF (GntR family)
MIAMGAGADAGIMIERWVIVAKLTDKQRKQIIADRADGLSFRNLATKYHVSATTIQRTLQNDPETVQKVTQKKEENTADILTYMESKRDIVCEILGKGLDVLNDEEKLKDATPAQITTAMGTLIDKWAMINSGPTDETREDELTKSLKELGKTLESDGDL